MKKNFIEVALDEEITAYTRAQRYEKTSQIEYRRKGYWKRYIILKDGRLQIDMPRLREAIYFFKHSLLQPYPVNLKHFLSQLLQISM